MNIIVVVALALFLAGGFLRQPKAVSSPPVVPTPTTKTLPTTKPIVPTVTVTVTSDWQYPGSSKTSSTTYESTDSSDKITDWYQDKIKQQGLNTRSFVKTKTNGQVLNKLAAVGISTEVKVEITQATSASITKITINY